MTLIITTKTNIKNLARKFPVGKRTKPALLAIYPLARVNSLPTLPNYHRRDRSHATTIDTSYVIKAKLL